MLCAVPNCNLIGVKRCPNDEEKLTLLTQRFGRQKRLTKNMRLCARHCPAVEVKKGQTYADLKESSKYHVRIATGISCALLEAIVRWINAPKRLKLNFHGLTHETQLLLCLKKLRHNACDALLAADFQIPERVVADVWKTWLEILHCHLQVFQRNPIPTISKNQLCLPQQFYGYGNTRIIIDATEVKIEKPSDLSLQAATWSNYKQSNTMKGLVAVAPCSAVVYVSKLYPGGLSDREIVEHCGVLKLLDTPGDNVMADKGFLVDDLLEEGVTLNVPVGKWKTKVFTKQECVESEKISSARAVVERAIRHMKAFKILKGPVCRQLLPHASKLFFVIGHLTNLEPCHFKDLRSRIEGLKIEDKFKGLAISDSD